MKAIPVDKAWLAAHPLPSVGDGLGKEERGRMVLVGGSSFVPGALLLTGEAALRAGAGKVQLGVIEPVALAVGLAFPECAVIALPADRRGEIGPGAINRLIPNIQRSETLVIGPGIIERPQTAQLVAEALELAGQDGAVLLDAGAMTALCHAPRYTSRRLIITPHHGELATMLDCDIDSIAHDPATAALRAARQFGAVVVLKSSETLIAAADGTLLRYVSGAPGLGTAGSGDVLAGVIGGLLARGADPVTAAAWGVWLHGAAGQRAA
ncbi:MAG: NAD(P)H-hydrate dehydratase, partial [Novosphingobium sp.]